VESIKKIDIYFIMWKMYAAKRAAKKLKEKEEKAARVLQFNLRAYLRRKRRLEEIRKIAEEKAKADAERAAKKAEEEERIKMEEEAQRQKVMGCCLPFRRR